MALLVDGLRSTQTSAWYPANAVGKVRERYYWAMLSCVASAREGEPVSRKALEAEVGAKSASTLYTLVKQRPDERGRPPRPEIFTLAAAARNTIRRPDVVDEFAIETKVWSFWSYREGWLEGLASMRVADRRFAAETLVRVVAAWATGNRPIAGYLENLPPVAAVEDLCYILPEETGLDRVLDFLGSVVRTALGPLGGSTSDVLSALQNELMDLGFQRSASYVDELVERVDTTLDEIDRLAVCLPAQARRRLASRIGLLREALDTDADSSTAEAS